MFAVPTRISQFANEFGIQFFILFYYLLCGVLFLMTFCCTGSSHNNPTSVLLNMTRVQKVSDMRLHHGLHCFSIEQREDHLIFLRHDV